MKLIMLGAPGAGKGTHSEFISRSCGIPTISTGQILRTAIKNGTPVGLAAKKYIDEGQLVPDDVIIGVMKERLSQADCENGYILDGMPRTIPQAEALENQGIEIDIALSIEADDKVIEERVSGRRACGDCGTTFHIVFNPPKAEGVCDNCGGELIQRPDDAPEMVKERLRVFHQETSPLKQFYQSRGKLTAVESQQEIADTRELISKALGILL